MNKYKKIVSIAATEVMCVAPMSVYAQEAQTDVIEAVAEKKQDTESSSVPVLQKEGIEISEGTGYDLSKEPGAATVKALEQGTIVISYKTTSENAIQSLLSVGNYRSRQCNAGRYHASGNRCLSIWRFHRENAGISGCTF